MPADKSFRLLLLLALVFLPLPVAAQPAPAQPAPAAGPDGLPRQVPAFDVRDFDGRPRPWSSLTGKLTLVDFWATWCQPCRDTLPQLQAVHAKFSQEGDFGVIGIALERTQGGAARASRFAKDLGVQYPLYNDFGNGEAAKAFGVRAIPDLYLVDPEGNIVERWVGSDTDFDEVEATVAKWLEKLRAGKKLVKE